MTFVTETTISEHFDSQIKWKTFKPKTALEYYQNRNPGDSRKKVKEMYFWVLLAKNQISSFLEVAGQF